MPLPQKIIPRCLLPVTREFMYFERAFEKLLEHFELGDIPLEYFKMCNWKDIVSHVIHIMEAKNQLLFQMWWTSKVEKATSFDKKDGIQCRGIYKYLEENIHGFKESRFTRTLNGDIIDNLAIRKVMNVKARFDLVLFHTMTGSTVIPESD